MLKAPLNGLKRHGTLQVKCRTLKADKTEKLKKPLKAAQSRTELYKTQATPLITEKQQNLKSVSNRLKKALKFTKHKPHKQYHKKLQNLKSGSKKHETSHNIRNTNESKTNCEYQKAAQNGTEHHKTQATMLIAEITSKLKKELKTARRITKHRPHC